MKKTNAERFIAAYNKIDYGLRTIYDFKRSMSFSDVIRRSVVLNSVVRKYEEDLIDYGRLRNAIIHNGNSKYTIAEPHDDIVLKIEKLAELITEPPLAVDRVGNKEVIIIDKDLSIAKAIELIARTGYSNLPVYDNNKLLGIINGRKLINVLGYKLADGVNLQDFVDNTTVGEIISEMGEDYFFMLADEDITIDEAMNYFENNRKLLIILITKDGKDTSKPLAIISSSDIIDMKKILDVY
ncbi:MAG TPA: CBS domain-containing protein [Candidatus Onthoplasma faecipullorum]|nr:CBS domain-containing protein [Candidatus Onthoplasma faecipullorum]